MPPQKDDTTPDAPMTVEERHLARALIKYQFEPGSINDQFCQDLTTIVRARRFRLTSAQRACLWRLGHQCYDHLPEAIQSILNYRAQPH